ncbi:hypothetical protein Ahy_B01g054071 [Arachis hypogaea]|uniref:Uncharacterized protein n=1 Tax=Arachis hypogaea TaxID=3818 RepID=A0A445AT89_ARAHY|nr:hypothetical protein Ahy_B01g054071 [Arachis hypogaea]
MTDEVSNGNAEISNNTPITATKFFTNLIPHVEYNYGENIAVIDASVGGSGRNSRPTITPVQNQPQVIAGWLPFGLPPGYTPHMESMAEFRQYIDESHHNLVNLLTHQMITILNPILVDNESKYDRLVKQVERIVRIVDYDEGQPIPQIW